VSAVGAACPCHSCTRAHVPRLAEAGVNIGDDRTSENSAQLCGGARPYGVSAPASPPCTPLRLDAPALSAALLDALAAPPAACFALAARVSTPSGQPLAVWIDRARSGHDRNNQLACSLLIGRSLLEPWVLLGSYTLLKAGPAALGSHL